jgi:nucleoside-diphosphate-sugar epimerase
MPSKRFWAKNNPEQDFQETVNKTIFFIKNFNYKKFIHISSISARCQLSSVYGVNKKKSEDIVLKNSKNLVLRLGPLYGDGLDKGVLIDMLNSKTVYINGNSKYSFTHIGWVCEWVIKNLISHKGIKEIGSKDYFTLSQLAEKINSKSNFKGEIDDQLIMDDEKYSSKSKDVLIYLKNFR